MLGTLLHATISTQMWFLRRRACTLFKVVHFLICIHYKLVFVLFAQKNKIYFFLRIRIFIIVNHYRDNIFDAVVSWAPKISILLALQIFLGPKQTHLR